MQATQLIHRNLDTTFLIRLAYLIILILKLSFIQIEKLNQKKVQMCSLCLRLKILNGAEDSP